MKPRWILLFLYIGVIVTSALATSVEGDAGIAMIVLVLLFESGIFSIIFAMCIRGLGGHTKLGAVALTASTSGGAVIPAIMSPVVHQRGVRYAFAVVVAVFAFGSLLPIYTAVVPAAKDQVDPVHRSREEPATSARSTTSSRPSQLCSTIRRRHKSPGKTAREEQVERDKEMEPG